MKLLPELLTAVFTTLTGNNDPKVLALTARWEPSDQERGSGPTTAFWFPDAVLPLGVEHHPILAGESFVAESLAKVTTSEATCIFSFPPLMGMKHLSQEWRQKFGRLEIPEALAEVLVGSGSLESADLFSKGTSPVQVFAMLVPRHFLRSSRTDAWRREFFPGHSAVVIEIEHSESIEGLVPGISPLVALDTLVIFQRQPGPIRFFKITEAAHEGGIKRIIEDLIRLLRQPAGKSKYGFVHQGQIVEDYPCSYDFYSDETKKLREEIGILGENVPLASIADVYAGFPAQPRQAEVVDDTTAFYYITARDIQADGQVDLSELQTQHGVARVRHWLEDGDFCIPRIYRAGKGLTVGVYEGEGGLVTFNGTVIVVRPHATLNPAQRQVLLSFLRSPLAQRLSNAKLLVSNLGNHYNLTTSILRDFPVPIANPELVTAIQQLSEAKAAFAGWIKQINDDENAILMATSASGGLGRLLEGGRLARQRHRAAQQVEEFDYRVRTQFPHPLAYVWRELQVSGDDRYRRLRAVLKAAEGHTCFLALVGMLLGKAIDQPIAYVGEIAKRLARRQSGTNFGDWFAILKELNESHAFRKVNGVTPFVEITQLKSNEKWESSVRRLMELRNDDSHGRIAPAGVSPSLLAEAESALESVYRASEFLTDYQYIWVTETHYDSIRKVNYIQFRDLTGDNPLAQLRKDQTERADIETGSLYLRDRQGELHLFRPYLQYLECPECHLMSTFFLDTYDGGASADTVGLKSFERNSVRMVQCAEEFRHIGLL
jgi:hypothetical protein